MSKNLLLSSLSEETISNFKMNIKYLSRIRKQNGFEKIQIGFEQKGDFLG